MVGSVKDGSSVVLVDPLARLATDRIEMRGEESSELAVHGLYREIGDETVRSTFFSGETLAAARDLDFELR